MKLKQTLLFLGLSLFASSNLYAHSLNSVIGSIHIHPSEVIAAAIIIFLFSAKRLMVLIPNRFFKIGE